MKRFPPYLLFLPAGAALTALLSQSAPAKPAGAVFSQVQAATGGDFGLAFLHAGGSADELSKLCKAGVCTMLPVPKSAKPPKPPAAKPKPAKDDSKLGMLKDLQSKVTKALSKLQHQDKSKGKLVSVKKTPQGYALRYEGSQEVMLPPVKGLIAWFNFARDETREMVAFKYLDEEGIRHRFILAKGKWRNVTSLEGVVERGSFSSAWLKAGGPPPMLAQLQQAMPTVNLSRIQRGFMFRVLVGPGRADLKSNIKAIEYHIPEPVPGTGRMIVQNIRGIRAVNRFVPPEANQFVAENWPIPGLPLEELPDRLILTSPRSLASSRPVTALTDGVVGLADRDWWVVSVDYHNGFSILYDGLRSGLKPGATVKAGDRLGVAPYGSLVLRAKTGVSPFGMKGDIPKFRQQYTLAPAAKLRALFESPSGSPDKKQLSEIRFWNFLLTYFAEESFPQDPQG